MTSTTPARNCAFPDSMRDFQCGLSKREYFAAKAMQTLIAEPEENVAAWIEDEPRGDSMILLATVAYAIADAMVLVGKKEKS